MEIQKETNDRFDKLEIALKKGELDKYLIGEGFYQFHNKWVEEPTDLGAVFISGLNLYIEKYGKGNLNIELAKALKKLLDSPIGCWWVVVIIYSYHFRFIENALKFNLKLEMLMPDLNLKLNHHKPMLINNISWVGYRFNNGLWGQVEKFIPKINEVLKAQNIEEIKI